jgi:hypothetical protein
VTLPNFLVIGAHKCGTTSLYQYLAQHPEVFVSPVKEANYFWWEGQAEDRFSAKTRSEYERLFEGVKGEKAIGEASPQYLNNENSAERIRGELPGAKLVVSLRNPADRAYSHYLTRLRNGRETRRAVEALQAESLCVQHGFYYPRLLRYYERFPRERIHVILFDDLVSDSQAIMRRLFEFLGVDAAAPIDTKIVHNPGSAPRSAWITRWLLRAMSLRFHVLPHLPGRLRGHGLAVRLHKSTLREAPQLDPVLRRRLLEGYRDDIGRTGELIGRDLSLWLERAAER